MAAKNVVDPAIERTRKRLGLGFAGIAIVFIAAAGLYALGVFDGHTTAGKDYVVIEGRQPPHPGEPVSIVEYFSYTCPHCAEFDPQVEDFRAHLPAGVTFKRVPVVFADLQQELFARTYLALEATDALNENHKRIFRALHEEGRPLQSVEQVAQLVDGHGIYAPAFLRIVSSGPVTARLNAARQAQVRDAIMSIPTLVVGDYYRIEIGTVGRSHALKVATELVRQLQKGAQGQRQ
jgi:thiol:disulfide interchange protein DsbA